MVIFGRTADRPEPDDAPDGPARLGDPEAVARVAAGDVEALGVLYDRFGGPVHSLALHVCGDLAVAEAVTREVFLAVRRHADRFDPGRGSVATWLLTMARHRAVEARRRSPGTVQLCDGRSADVPNPEADLTPEQREVVGLAYFEGFTQLEIARIQGRPADAVLADLAQAMERLRPEA